MLYQDTESRKKLWWGDLGWLPGAHPAALTPPPKTGQGGEKKMKMLIFLLPPTKQTSLGGENWINLLPVKTELDGKKQRKNTKHFHFFNPKSSASPSGTRLENGSCGQPTTTLLCHFLLMLFPCSSMGFSIGSAGESGSPPPALPLRALSPSFPHHPGCGLSHAVLGRLDLAISSKGQLWLIPQWDHPADPGHLHPHRPTNWIHKHGSQGCILPGEAWHHSQLSFVITQMCPISISLSVSVHKVGTLS